MTRIPSLARLLALIALGACLGLSPSIAAESAKDPSAKDATAKDALSVKDVLKTYADIAQAGYTDSLITARTLQLAVNQLLAQPTEDNLIAARAAWIAARVPYMQTEAFRFGNAIVDDWEGRVNSWPLDEGLIDYVSGSYGTDSPENELYAADVIANVSLTIGGKKIDASKITKELLADKLQEAGGVEANVATGYHAIEFLLWGQDLNGTGPGTGNRPASDFDTGNCTGGHCDRRTDYLRAATDLLVDDLAWMVPQWGTDGAARRTLMDSSNEAGLTAILTGIGSLSYGELAGERIKLGLMIHDPEEEHDCFSDNTFASHYFDALGMRNVYLGRYRRVDGSVITGPSVSDLIKAKSPGTDQEMRAKLAATMDAMGTMYSRGIMVESYDQMIGEGNDEGNAVVQHVVDRLLDQTKAIERAVAVLDLKRIEFQGSNSLGSPEKVESGSASAATPVTAR
jgi:putative iron-regulated protein